MKKLTVFILLLLSSTRVSACGYSPHGEDVRYCLFAPEYFHFGGYSSFYYNADLWGDYYSEKKQPEFYQSNILDWYRYTGKKVSLKSIEQFNENFKLTDINL